MEEGAQIITPGLLADNQEKVGKRDVRGWMALATFLDGESLFAGKNLSNPPAA